MIDSSEQVGQADSGVGAHSLGRSFHSLETGGDARTCRDSSYTNRRGRDAGNAGEITRQAQESLGIHDRIHPQQGRSRVPVSSESQNIASVRDDESEFLRAS